MSFFRNLIFLICTCFCSCFECDISDAKRSNLNELALSSLEGGGFRSMKGELFFNQQDGIGNPDGKYGVANFTSSSRPFLLNYYCEMYVKKLMQQEQGFCDVFFEMGASDAFVWLACLPPEIEYFSLSFFLGLRFDPSQMNPFAQFGDSINQLVVNSTAAKSQKSFCKTALFIATADAKTFWSIRNAYVMAGFPESAINLYPIPQNVPKFKHGIWYFNKYDLFSLQFRVNGYENQPLVQSFLKKKQTVYLVQKKTGWWDFGLFGGATKPEEPVVIPPLRPRGDGTSEIENHGKDFEQLKGAVQEHFQENGYELVYSFDMVHKVPNLTRCMVDPEYSPVAPPIAAELYNITFTGCDWFTSDALYTFPPDELQLELVTMTPSRVFVVVGLNQVMMGKCQYYNFLFSSGTFLEFEMPGHGFDFSCSDAEGSATAFGPDIPNVDKMITWTFARPGFCKSRPWCTEFNREEVPGLVYSVERKYLEASTKIGPDPHEVMPPSILIFDTVEAVSF